MADVPESRIDVVKDSATLSGPGVKTLEAGAFLFYVEGSGVPARVIKSVDYEAGTAEMVDVWTADSASYTYPSGWWCMKAHNKDGAGRFNNPMKPETPPKPGD